MVSPYTYWIGCAGDVEGVGEGAEGGRTLSTAGKRVERGKYAVGCLFEFLGGCFYWGKGPEREGR
jgi:hypothetical protein